MSYPITTSGPIQSSATNTRNNSPVLKEGQMIHGQIKQLYPGQMAEVQIGDQKLIAKLEVPMKAGDSYYFRVKSVKPELQLKIIAGPTAATEGQGRQLSSLMDAMQLPKTDEMRTLLSFAFKNKVTLNREELVQAERFLRRVPASAQAAALSSIQKVSELKLPFIENVFRSLLGVETKEGLHTILASLKGLVTSDPTVPLRAQETILSTLDNMTKPFAEATGNALLGKSLSILLDQKESPEIRFSAVQLLKNARILPEQTSLANFQQVLTSLMANETTAKQQGQQVAGVQTTQDILKVLQQVNSAPPASEPILLGGLKSLVSTAPEISVANKEILTAMIDRMTSLPPSVEATSRFVQAFSQALIRMGAENLLNSPFQVESKEQLLTLLGQQGQVEVSGKLMTLVQNAERSSNPVIQQLTQSAEGAVASVVSGQVVKDAMQMIVRSLGLNYEATLFGKEPDIGRLAESLKPQLIALMQDPTVSQAVRDGAEAVVMRMNGSQLVSGENGVQHQLVMQIPLEFFGKRVDAMLEWNGRLKDDGKIDPDFARILFYLDLHSLEKTVIDMQVQNRIVSITVFNADTSIQAISLLVQDKLSVGLEAIGYQLSGVSFKSFIEEEKASKHPKNKINVDGGGVDFQI